MEQNTAVTQRRLMEALAELYKTSGLDIGRSPDPLVALATGIHAASQLALAAGEPEITNVYVQFGRLILAVREDLSTKEETHG